MQFEQIETERLILKKLSPEGYNFIFANYPDEEIKKLFGLKTEEEMLLQRKKVQDGFTTYNRTILSFLFELKENGETIGRGGFHNWYTEHRKAELGYALYSDLHKRKGYTTEAVKAILDHGFKNMDLNRIEAFTGTMNTASQNILKKYGFKQEGYLRQHYIREEAIEDSLLFALLKEEYKT